jgi:phage-related minor tail protein
MYVNSSWPSSVTSALQRIETVLAQISGKEIEIVSDIDNLNTALSGLADDVGSLKTDFDAAVKALQDAVSAGDSAAIQAATAKVADLDSQIKAVDQAAKALVPSTS